MSRVETVVGEGYTYGRRGTRSTETTYVQEEQDETETMGRGLVGGHSYRKSRATPEVWGAVQRGTPSGRDQERDED